MAKVQKIAEITPNLPFSEFNFYDLYRSTFEKSELGRIKKLLPLHKMALNFGVASESMSPKRGRKSFFTPEGKVALMFLKMYTGLSCPKLMEQLKWKPYMQNLDTLYTDATCYESEMRYPTDQKLLWEGIEKAYETMCELSQRLGIHRPRTKFIDVQKANLTYRKQRKHSKSPGQDRAESTAGGCLKRKVCT